MGNNVFANGREVSCKAGDGKSICAFPDVCMTPPENPATPPGVPIPYPNTGMAKDTAGGSKSVKISKKETMLKNQSHFKKSMGDEAGSAAKKGVVTSVNRGKIYFTSWSMDVKFEGKNVVRHLDMTTHNHASLPSNTGPWPYADAQAVAPGGACHEESKAIKRSGKCSEPVAEDTSKACCSVPERQCVMVPFKDRKTKCCRKGRETTGHHPLPVQEICEEGSRSEGKAIPSEGHERYDDDAAPTICVKGHYHRSRYASGELMEHGLFGNAYRAGRDAALAAGRRWNYDTASEVGAEAVEKETNKVCSKKCIKHQLDDYHNGKVDRRRTLNVSKQPMHPKKKPRPKKMRRR